MLTRPTRSTIPEVADQGGAYGTLLTDAEAGRLAVAIVTEIISGTGGAHLVCQMLDHASTRPSTMLALAALAARLSLVADGAIGLEAIQRLALEHELSLLPAATS